MNKTAQGAVAEFVGTFALVFFGAGAIVLTATHPQSGADLITVALAHGLVLAVFVTGALHISGGQFNPAVSIGLIIAGKQEVSQAGIFIAAQLLGAASAAGMLVAVLSPQVANSAVAAGVEGGTNVGATIGSLTLEGAWGRVFALEVLMTFALMWGILRCLADDRAVRLGGLTVGITVATCIVAFGPLTGASLNPARTFGPALYGHWDMHWVYWAAPIVGAALASLVERTVFTPIAETPAGPEAQAEIAHE